MVEYRIPAMIHVSTSCNACFHTTGAHYLNADTTAIYLEMPLSDKASEIETILNTEHDAIMTESETVDEGIANMNEQVQALLG